jgi:hypothetical protein
LRIDLADSVVAIRAGDFDRAGHILNVALRRSRSTSQVFWEWKILNNLAVIGVQEGRLEEATRLFDSAASLTDSLRTFATATDVDVRRLVPIPTTSDDAELPPAPPLSGAWHLLAHNVDVMRQKTERKLPGELTTFADRSLRVETGIGPLYLALE